MHSKLFRSATALGNCERNLPLDFRLHLETREQALFHLVSSPGRERQQPLAE